MVPDGNIFTDSDLDSQISLFGKPVINTNIDHLQFTDQGKNNSNHGKGITGGGALSSLRTPSIQ
jgi:hypothetical protein